MKTIKNTMIVLMLGMTMMLTAQPTPGVIYTSTSTYSASPTQTLPAFITTLYYPSGFCVFSSPAIPITSTTSGTYGYGTGITFTTGAVGTQSAGTALIPGPFYTNGGVAPGGLLYFSQSTGANAGIKDTGIYVVGYKPNASTTWTSQNIFLGVCQSAIPTPTAGFTQNTQSVCVNGVINFTNTSSSASLVTTYGPSYTQKIWPSKYTWIITGPVNLPPVIASPGATTQPGSLGTPLSYTFNTPGTYTISLNATNWSGPNSNMPDPVCTQTQIVTVYANPTVSASNASVCPGKSVTLNASGASSYTWNTGAYTSSISVSPSIPTNYTVTGIYGNGCKNSTTLSVSIGTNPALSVSQPPFPICAGNNLTLTATSSNGTITWPNGNQVVSPTANTTYTIISTLNGCITSSNISVATNPLPTVSVVYSPTICMNTNSTIVANGASTYTWNGVSFGISLLLNVSTNTVINVVGTDGNGCFNSTTVSINAVDCTTGIGENHLNSSIKVYPNPSNGEFFVEAENGTVQVFTLTGQLISTTELNGKTPIHVEAAGMYVIKLTVDGRVYSSRLINQ